MLKATLNNPRSFWIFLAAFSGVAALLKGLQLPSVVPATQAQLDYSAGLIKRGLFGTVAEHLHLPIYHYSVFAVVAFVILAAACAIVVWATWRSGLARSQLGLLACAVFFSSYAVTYASSLVGRLDIIQLGLVAVIVAIRRSDLRNAVLLVALPLAILLHENFFVAFLPVCLLPTAVDILMCPKDGKLPWAGMVLAAAALIASLVAVYMIALRPYPHPEALRGLYDRIVGRIDFEPDDTTVGILSRGAANNLLVMRAFVWRPGYRNFDLWLSFLTFLPSCAYLVLCARKMLVPINPARTALALAAIVACVLTPLSLNVQGADMDRWNAFILFDGFAALLAVSGFAAGRGVTLADPAPIWTHAAIFLLATNLAAGGGLLEQKCMTPYPFRAEAQSLYNTLHGHPPEKPKQWHSGQGAC